MQVLGGLFMDIVLMVLLVIAIGLGGVLLLQINTLRRERFRFDQMTKALAAQMSIFQSALESGKLDLETKITRMAKATEKAQLIVDEMHSMMADAAEAKPRGNIMAQQAPAQRKAPSVPPRMERAFDDEPRDDRPLFSIIDPEFMANAKEDKNPAVDDFGDLTELDKRELEQLATPAEKALMAALKRAGQR